MPLIEYLLRQLTFVALEAVGVWWQVGGQEKLEASTACRLEVVAETIRRQWQARGGGDVVQTKVDEVLHGGREADVMQSETPQTATRMEPSSQTKRPADTFRKCGWKLAISREEAMFNRFCCN